MVNKGTLVPRVRFGAMQRLGTALGIAIAAYVAQPSFISLHTRVIASWDLGAIFYLALAWWLITRTGVEETRRHALARDQSSYLAAIPSAPVQANASASASISSGTQNAATPDSLRAKAATLRTQRDDTQKKLREANYNVRSTTSSNRLNASTSNYAIRNRKQRGWKRSSKLTRS